MNYHELYDRIVFFIISVHLYLLYGTVKNLFLEGAFFLLKY